MQFLIRDDKEKIPFYDLEISENLVIAHIDGAEIFRASFNPDNFIEKFRIIIPPSRPSETVYNLVRKNLNYHGVKKTVEEIEEAVRLAQEEILKIVAEEKVNHTAHCISENLHGLVAAILDDAIKAYAIYGTIELHQQAGKPISVERLKKIVLKTHWSRIAELANIKRGGYKGKKGFWNDDKKIQFYQKVDNLPKVKGQKIWKYIFDELSFVDFDLETQTWLKQRPELQIIPDFLFDEAVEKWRKYNSIRELTEHNEKPRFFEYRLALYLLEYPDEFEFTTLDTYYKQGKNFFKNRDSQTTTLKSPKDKRLGEEQTVV